MKAFYTIRLQRWRDWLFLLKLLLVMLFVTLCAAGTTYPEAEEPSLSCFEYDPSSPLKCGNVSCDVIFATTSTTVTTTTPTKSSTSAPITTTRTMTVGPTTLTIATAPTSKTTTVTTTTSTSDGKMTSSATPTIGKTTSTNTAASSTTTTTTNSSGSTSSSTLMVSQNPATPASTTSSSTTTTTTTTAKTTTTKTTTITSITASTTTANLETTKSAETGDDQNNSEPVASSTASLSLTTDDQLEAASLSTAIGNLSTTTTLPNSPVTSSTSPLSTSIPNDDELFPTTSSIATSTSTTLMTEKLDDSSTIASSTDSQPTSNYSVEADQETLPIISTDTSTTAGQVSTQQTIVSPVSTDETSSSSFGTTTTTTTIDKDSTEHTLTTTTALMDATSSSVGGETSAGSSSSTPNTETSESGTSLDTTPTSWRPTTTRPIEASTDTLDSEGGSSSPTAEGTTSTTSTMSQETTMIHVPRIQTPTLEDTTDNKETSTRQITEEVTIALADSTVSSQKAGPSMTTAASASTKVSDESSTSQSSTKSPEQKTSMASTDPVQSSSSTDTTSSSASLEASTVTESSSPTGIASASGSLTTRATATQPDTTDSEQASTPQSLEMSSTTSPKSTTAVPIITIEKILTSSSNTPISSTGETSATDAATTTEAGQMIRIPTSVSVNPSTTRSDTPSTTSSVVLSTSRETTKTASTGRTPTTAEISGSASSRIPVQVISTSIGPSSQTSSKTSSPTRASSEASKTSSSKPARTTTDPVKIPVVITIETTKGIADAISRLTTTMESLTKQTGPSTASSAGTGSTKVATKTSTSQESSTIAPTGSQIKTSTKPMSTSKPVSEAAKTSAAYPSTSIETQSTTTTSQQESTSSTDDTILDCDGNPMGPMPVSGMVPSKTQCGAWVFDVPEATTETPSSCLIDCPAGYDPVDNFCLIIQRPDVTTTYSRGFSACKGLGAEMLGLTDWINETVAVAVMDMAKKYGYPGTLYYVNMRGSRAMKNERETDLYNSALYQPHMLDPGSLLVKQYGMIDTPQKSPVSAVCKKMAYCQPPTCPLEEFDLYADPKVVQFPTQAMTTAGGPSHKLKCLINTTKTISLKCSPSGYWLPHPSMINCPTTTPPPNTPRGEQEVLNYTKWNDDCRVCSPIGTKYCSFKTGNTTEPTKYRCVCKQGFEGFYCTYRTLFCANVSADFCHKGRCIEGTDGPECECPEGMGGESCALNFTKRAWNPEGDELPIIDGCMLGYLFVFWANMWLLIIKWILDLGKFYMSLAPESRHHVCIQGQTQWMSQTTLSLWGIVQLCFDRPDLFAVNLAACRMYHFLTSTLSQYISWCWAVQSLNAYLVASGIGLNRYVKDTDEKNRWWLDPFWLNIFPCFFAIAFNMALISWNWKQTGSLWTCSSRFTQTTYTVWGPEMAVQISCLALSIYFLFKTWQARAYWPHGWIRTIQWFMVNRRLDLEKVLRVDRNFWFLLIGPVIHFSHWFSSNMASTLNTKPWTWTAGGLGLSYAIFMVIQDVITYSTFYEYLVTFMTCWLPEKCCPKWNPVNLMSYKETLYKYRKSSFIKQKKLAEKEEKARKEKLEQEIIDQNKALIAKHGSLPKELLRSFPERPPDSCHPVWQFKPDCEDYIPAYERQSLKWEMAICYWSHRACSRINKGFASRKVTSALNKHGMMSGGSRGKQMRALYVQFHREIVQPDKYDIVDDEIEDRLLLKDDGGDLLAKFENAVLKFTEHILPESRQKLLDRENHWHIDTAKIKGLVAWCTYLPARYPEATRHINERLSLSFLKAYDYFYRPPEIVLESQNREEIDTLNKKLEAMNIRFDRVYEDDACFQKWIGTEWEEAAREILKPWPAHFVDPETGKTSPSLNPRNKPLEDFFFDQERPGFIGPEWPGINEKGADARDPNSSPHGNNNQHGNQSAKPVIGLIELGPFRPFIKAGSYFQRNHDLLWKEKWRKMKNQQWRLSNGPHPLDTYALGSDWVDPIEISACAGNPYDGPY